MSFSYDDAKWGAGGIGTGSGTITWSSDFGSALNYDETRYDEADFQFAMADAFQAWEDVANIDFEYTTGDADVDVVMGPLSGSTVGQASVSYYVLPGTDQYISGRITMDSLEEWAPFGETDLSFFAVALHEVGHVLGLEHVNDTSEIMNPVISTNTLGDGDIAGIIELYGPAGGAVPVAVDPGPTPAPTVVAFEPTPDPTPPPAPSAPSAPEDPAPAPVADDDGGNFFSWFFDLFRSLFGGGSDDDSTTVAAARAPEIATEESVVYAISDLVPVLDIPDDDHHYHDDYDDVEEPDVFFI
ncbi:MAG: matrixin family metalloprotease [Alphaproteobacteria bacterium]|nr:matrixin family metalloprotease [Alphaproteobacteria bacterium]